MEQFTIFMGGTGARCAEAFAYLSACGLMGQVSTQALLVDADQSNGNLIRAGQVLGRYQRLHQALSAGRDAEDSLLSMPLSARQWILGMQEKVDFRLAELNEGDNASRRAMSALYTASEMERKITTVGFFAHPNVGASVMRSVLLRDDDTEDEHKQSAYGRFRRRIETALNVGEVRVMLMGSVFGGTGASALPALAKDIEALAGNNPVLRQRLRIGAVLMLPYFTIAIPVRRDGQVDASQFPLATQAALRYYREQSGRLFDRTYLVGCHAPAVVENMGTGGGEQENPPMVAEWEAALAASHFFAAEDQNTQELHYIKWMNYTPDGRMVIDWPSFSHPQAQQRLAGMVLFSAFYLRHYLPEIVAYRSRKGPPNWYANYVREYDHTDAGRATIEQLGTFLQGFLRWFCRSLCCDQVEQHLASRALLEQLAAGKGRGLEDAGYIVPGGGKPVRVHRILTAMHQGSGLPLTFPTFIHHLYAECGMTR